MLIPFVRVRDVWNPLLLFVVVQWTKKMTVEKGIIGTQYEEEEEERGGMRKMGRSEEEEEAEEDTSVMRSELPPGRRECQQLKEHTTCLANRTNRNGCFF